MKLLIILTLNLLWFCFKLKKTFVCLKQMIVYLVHFQQQPISTYFDR